MIVKVKKIWYGGDTIGVAKVSLRDYDVNEALANNEKLVVQYKDMKMTLTPKQLETEILESSVFKSKIGKRNYKLLDYEWKPDKLFSAS